MSYTRVDTSPVIAADVSWQQINLTANVVLYWPNSYGTGLVAASRNDVMPSGNGFTISLPDATLASNGQDFLFNNISTYSFRIMANDGTTVITTINAGVIVYLYLVNSTTANGQWRITPFGGGTNNIVSFTAASSDNSIIITNGTLNPPGGEINFSLPPSLSFLNTVNTKGFLIITDVAPLTWTTAETLLAGHNITIDNPDGMAGLPVINVSPSIEELTALEVGSFYFTNRGCQATDDGDLTFLTNTGVLGLNGVTFDISGNVTIPTNLTVNGVFNNVLMPKAFVSFTDTITGSNNIITPTNTIAIQDHAYVSTVTGSEGTYVIVFTEALANAGYAVFIGFGSAGGEIPPTYNGVWTVRKPESVTIAITDASGELVTSAPYGVSVTVMASG